MKCCNKELGNLFIEKDGKIMISGKVAFHFYDTHGLPTEVTEWAVNNWRYREGSRLRHNLSA